MSLIQQALERAKEATHSKVLAYREIQETAKKEILSQDSGEADIKLKPYPKAGFPTGRKYPRARWILLGIFGVALAVGFIAIYFFLNDFGKTPSSETPVPAPTLSPVKILPKNPVKEPSRDMRDLVLNGITMSGEERLALINNQIVSVGDTLKENTVVKSILSRSVVIEHQGKEMTLSLD